MAVCGRPSFACFTLRRGGEVERESVRRREDARMRLAVQESDGAKSTNQRRVALGVCAL